jgi:hypothetical protein
MIKLAARVAVQPSLLCPHINLSAMAGMLSMLCAWVISGVLRFQVILAFSGSDDDCQYAFHALSAALHDGHHHARIGGQMAFGPLFSFFAPTILKISSLAGVHNAHISEFQLQPSSKTQ